MTVHDGLSIPDLTDIDYIIIQIENASRFYIGRHYRQKQTDQTYLLIHASLLRASDTCMLSFNFIQVDEKAIHPIVIQTLPAYDFYGNRYFIDVSGSFPI